MTKYLNKNLIAVAILAAGVLITGVFVYINQGGGGTLSPQTAAEKAIAFINQSIQEENVTASLIDVVEKSGVYKIHLKIAETEYDSYITKDGKFLFASGFNLTAEVPEETTEETAEISQEEPQRELASLTNLAQCLTDKGAKFYGAFWCSWCNKEKELFDEAAQYLPYIECSDQETKKMLPICQEAGIISFPTWEFNGEKSSGFKSLEQLAEISGCPLK